MVKLLKYLLPPKRPTLPQRPTARDLIRKESAIGGKLFGIIRPGHKRDFFCLDASTWVWYEQWVDENNRKQSITTRYELHGKTLFKYQTGHPPSIVHGEELKNFTEAVRRYYYEVAEKVYSRPVAAS